MLNVSNINFHEKVLFQYFNQFYSIGLFIIIDLIFMIYFLNHIYILYLHQKFRPIYT